MPSVNADLPMIAEKPSLFDFDLLSYKYDSWYESAKGRMYDHLEKKAISRYLQLRARGKKLLEVGCGTGHWSQFFSEYGFEITGVDISERMITPLFDTIGCFLHIPYGAFIAAEVKL